MTQVMCVENRKELPVYAFEHHEKVSAVPLGQNTWCFYEHKVRNKNTSVMTDSLFAIL